MRIPRVIEADLVKEREAYHEATSKEPVSKLQERSAKIKKLMVELAEACTVGANPCPTCGNKPHGMRRRPGLFEVGCLTCVEHRAQGESVEDAVDRWNTGDWGTDLIPGKPPLQVLIDGDEAAGIPPNPKLKAAVEKLRKAKKG